MAGIGDRRGPSAVAGRDLKVSEGRVQIVGADPSGSVYSGGSGRPYLVEGVGEDFWPTTFDRTICDRVIEVSDADSFAMTRRMAREEALLVGGSCGMAAMAAVRLAGEIDDPDAVVVVLLPDSGRGYLGKIFNDTWLSRYGFAPRPGAAVRVVGDVLREKSGELPSLVHTHPNETIAEAVTILREYGVSQMPVVKAEPPVMAAEVVGSVSERGLLGALFGRKARPADAVESVMEPPLPVLGATEPVGTAVRLLVDGDALLVLDDGKPTGVLTRQDLLSDIGRPARWIGSEQLAQRLPPVDRPRQRSPGGQRHPSRVGGGPALVEHHGFPRLRTCRGVDQADGVEVFDAAPRAAADPVRGLHRDQVPELDDLGGLLVHLAEHARHRLLVRVDAAARHSPTSLDRGLLGVLGGQQTAIRRHDRVRGDPLAEVRDLVRTEDETRVLASRALGRP